MESLPLPGRLRGVRQIGQGLGTLDREVFEAIAESPSPLLDATMPRLSRAADHSKLWLAIAAALAALGGPSAQRGAARGVLTLAVTSLFTNQVAKRVWRRPRPNSYLVPLARRGRRFPTSNSLPSGHSASAAAFAVGVGLENPPLGLAVALLAGLVGLSRVATGAHYPGDVFAGFGIGAGIAVLGARVVPPVTVAKIPVADPLRVDTRERPDGAGVVLVVNPASGGGTGARVIDEVRESLPRAEIVELSEDDDVEKALCEAAKRAEALAVGGGDGTVSCAAAAALDAGLPLAVFPGGTFNHFAKDIGCDSVGKTVDTIPVRDAAHAAARRAGAHRLRQHDAADLAVLSRQFDVSAVGVRAVAAEPNRRRPARRADPGDGPTVEQGADSGGARAGTPRAQPAVSRAAGAGVHLYGGGRADPAGA